ncbi:TonB dependent/Ligand-Gated channel TonB [Azorhizobium oxalatiphilum]|uniref:TonB dependent/Ligand-Gated channel TonB n=1 Tax=Azorhizobium oxalatiphilum TaxID=980631 RepID=A0A917F767_9HYPH|nr:TonB-dependent receptor [Azorhizobium oxalatiphilum]GGF54068.1 TonB dependent/Ligand-Gated channel TonB [Azorhizobium oxalatiphilum]
MKGSTGAGTKAQWLASTFLALATAGTATMAPAVAQAQAQTFSFNIPQKSIRAAMNDIVRVTGIDVVFAETPAASRTGNAVRGSMTAGQAVEMLLAGSGLTYRFSNATTVQIYDPAAPRAGLAGGTDGAIALDTVDVTGDRLPAPYAGGLIATGGGLGVLGERSVMDTPFTVTNYTSKLIQEQGAQSVADVVRNDPAIRNVDPTNVGNANYFLVRGVQVGNGAIAYQGLFGIAPNSQSTLAGIERVEILKGPGAFIGGISPSGVGAVINLVPKRAGDTPLTNLTTIYMSDAQFGGHLDVGRRFGAANELGVRANLYYRDGDTPIAQQSQELLNGTVGVDYRGEKFRWSLDFGHQVLNTDRMNNTVTPAACNAAICPPIAKAPAPTHAWVSPWNYSDFTDTYGLATAEYDFAPNWTAYAKAGFDTTDWDQLVQAGTNLQTNGNFTATTSRYLIDISRRSGETGVRGEFDTGPLNHKVTLAANTYIFDRSQANQPSGAFALPVSASNIYNPAFVAEPTVPFMVPAQQSSITFTSYAVSDTLSVLDERIQLTLGLRQQYVHVENYSIATGAQTSLNDSDALTPMIGLVVKPWENVSLYASYAEGLTAGVVVPTTYANGGEVLPPYVTKQYEAGVKVDWGKLLTTVSLFHTTQQSGIANLATNTFTADGETVYRGLEFDVAGEIRPDLRVLGGFVLLDAENTRTANGTYDGKTPTGTPDYTANLGLEWDPFFLKNLTLTGRLNATGAAWANSINNQKLPAWTTFDFGARYAFEREGGKPVIVQANLINAFNKGYWTVYPGFGLLYPSEARTFQISTTFQF